ncbi:hypothetical protein KPL70_021414 [Citrus sinensis]|nr:hypothetical protein KPL70_021414 [Citrus sinensis]
METNTSSTSTSSSSHISLSSTLSLPKSCSKHITSKIENLVEYSYIPESAQINESQFPIMSPYNLYKQKTSFTRSIRTLISSKRPLPKEYIQSSRLDQCALQASQSEQYVTMEIPSDLVANWKREGYTHLHLGGVRLILTLHGRKGLPVTARFALLDTRFKEYQHAVVGTVLTTLHAGSVLLTFYPNFNLSLEDPNLPTTLKVQIQLQGAEQTPTSKIATLHHQIVYQLQNHALDLPTPYTTSDALMILADTNTIPTIIQIPKQIQKQDLLKLMPLEWLTNYEHFHQNSEPLSYTVMITAVQTGQEKKLPIHGFSSEGYPVYPDKINGHFLWDVPEAHMCNPDCPCLDDTDIDEELEIMRRKKKKKKKKKSSYPPSSCKSFPPHPPPDPKPPVHPIRSCLMFSSHSYEESFPPLEKQTDTQTRVTSKPFVQSPITASGQPEEPKQYEAVLNWQTKNANAQNHTLQQLGKKIDRVANQVSQTETKVDSISHRLDQMYLHLQDRISELDADLRRMINNHIWGLEFNKKEVKIRKLKAELSRIDAEKSRPSLFTQPQPTPVSPPLFDTYAPFYTPSRPQQPVYNQFFGFSHLQLTPQPSSPKKARSKVQISEPRPKATSSSSTSTIPPEESPQDRPEPLKKDKGPMDQYHYHIVQTQSSVSSDSFEPETHNSYSSSSYDSSNASTDSESEYADITGILMATETADPSASTSTPIVDDNPSDQASQTEPIPPPVHEHSTKPSSASWFTFDDIPRHKWAARLQEFAAWIDLQGTKPNAQPQAVLREFMARFTGSLRDWLESLGEYRQLQFMESSVGTALNLIHEQFIGEKTASTEADRKEYHQMKCCSLKRHLLDAHYKRMSILFYKLNGFNEPSLKHVFIASLPPELQPDLQRKLTATNLSIADISLGKIFQMAMLSLDKICEQKEFFKDLMEDKKPFSEASKAVRLIQHLQHSSLLSENDDVESNFSEQSTQDDQTAFLIVESLDIFVISTVQTVNHVSTIPRPSLKMSILPSKFHKPIPVIGFIDTGANTSMIDPSVLPSDCWEPHSKLFRAVNGETFETTLITEKPIGIQFFPNCIIWKKIVASKLPDKDLLIGFDILHLVKSLFLTSSGVHYKQIFLPYTDTLRLYALSETPSPYSHISQKLLEFCPKNHSQFHHPSPLWKNEQFFIHLPFKLNEDINPTKASHPDGQYQPGPHIAIELFKFPDTHLNRKQIQQFLGIVNYVRDFIPKVAIHTSQLSRMLKKQCPPWGPAQTKAVKQLKVIAQAPPPLRIPTSGQRILQTDASDDYWSAILLEDINGVRHFCAHASGYYKFLINMDNSSFPRIFDFKNKLLPDKQLLSLKTWFAKYDFTVQHIKGNQNLIPDFLTRPAINKPALISSIQTIPVIAMNRQLPFEALNQRNFPLNISFQSAYQLQDFAKKFLYRFFFNVQTKTPDRFPNLCMEHLFLTSLTLSSLSIFEDELWYMWCLTTLYATKLVFPIKPVLTHLTTPEFSPDLLWTLFEWYSPLTWWRQQLQHLSTFHGLDKMSAQEANMWTTAFIVHMPYFQHPETRDYWTQDMAHEWRTYPHPYTFIHDTSITSVLKAYLMDLNNVPPPATDIPHTSIGPSHTLEIIPKTQGCTPGSSSSPHGILVMEQRPDYTNVLFQDAQDPWEDFQSLLHTDTPHYTVTNPNSHAPSTSQHMSEVDEEKYQQAEAYLDQRQRRRHKRQYEKDIGDVSPSHYPSTP